MRNIMLKEMKLSASPISYLFILAGFTFFLPGYPVLCGAFFTTLGIFQGFQYAREANDIEFSVLLPVSKKDTVKGKYFFVCFMKKARKLAETYRATYNEPEPVMVLVKELAEEVQRFTQSGGVRPFQHNISQRIFQNGIQAG